jgi:NAD(P)-dependent dehydrogenase (short-subunit alcohol dehydrogenase family)
VAEPDTPVVLVTGAAGAIGTALLRRFAAVGARTVGTDLAADPPAALADVVDRWVRADVTVPADMDAAVATAFDAFGHLDVVVANAGITALGSFEETSDDAFVRVMDVNLHGAVRTVRAALPALRASGGRLVAMSSVAGFAPVLGRPAYVASKHAVTGLFESLRHELAPDGVGVTVVHPTFLATSPADANPTAEGAAPGSSGRRTTGRLLGADDVAREVVRAVRRGDGQVFPGRTAKLAHVVHRWAPRLYARQMRRRLRTEDG